MNIKKPIPVTSGLIKALGFPALFIIAIAVVTSQTSIVGVIQGAGFGGGSFFIAILIAYILTLCYISTFAELALMMPKAGSISTYTAVSIGHFPAIIATLSGILAPAIFGNPAELLLFQHLIDSVVPGPFFSHIAIILLWLFALLNILGVNLFAKIESIITYTMLVTILVIGFAGINPAVSRGNSSTQIWHSFTHPAGSFFSLVALALWAFVSFEAICPLAEETKNPKKNIPRAMFFASIVMLAGYTLLAFAALRQVPSAQLVNTDIPHVVLGQALFGNIGKIIIALLAITTSSGFINSAVAVVSRILYGMAHHKQLPPIFKYLHPKYKTPWFGILFLAGISTISLFLLGQNHDTFLMLLISASSCYLVLYIIAHIDLIVLRKKYPQHERPYRSPLFLLPQIIGIISMVYAICNNAPTAELTGKVYLNMGLFMATAGCYAFFWVKFKMKKGLFLPEPIEQAIRD